MLKIYLKKEDVKSLKVGDAVYAGHYSRVCGEMLYEKVFITKINAHSIKVDGKDLFRYNPTHNWFSKDGFKFSLYV